MNRRWTKIVNLLFLVSAVAGSMGGCKCKGGADEEQAGIDRPTIVQKDPDAERPDVYFPAALMTDDVSLNQFIDRVLQVCYEGDYDGFRQLFGMQYKPPSQTAFERHWHGVKDIRINRVERHPKEDPPVYYVHAIVRLRTPDKEERLRRDVVISIYRENDDWRLGQAPGKIVKLMLQAETQPASGSQEAGSDY